MKLDNPFPPHKREVFRDAQYHCWGCGGNGQASGGMELHHIVGRESSAVYNAAPLCKRCHAAVGHTVPEHKRFFAKTLRYVNLKIAAHEYREDDVDRAFLDAHYTMFSDGK